MAYQPDLDWVDDAPPGFDTARMTKMQLGIADAHTIAEDASTVADQAQADVSEALATANAAQLTADEALAAVGSGGVQTVNDDVKRIYQAGTTPPDGVRPGDVVLSVDHPPQGPGSIPGLLTWVDASATGARDLATVLPDVSGNGNDVSWRDLSGQVPASVASLNGLPAFFFDGNTRYSRPGTHTGPRTFSGVVRFDAIQSADQPLFYTGGSDAIALGVRGSTGNLYFEVGATVVYDAPLSWGAGGVAYVSFVLTVGASATLWLSGSQVATASVAGGGGYSTLALGTGGSGFIRGALGELAEHHGVEVAPEVAVELAAYYREKWRV